MQDNGLIAAQKRGPKVWFWDDERGIGNSLIVTLSPGWAFYDNVPTPVPGSDACHVEGFDTVKEAMKAVVKAAPCFCDRCEREKA